MAANLPNQPRAWFRLTSIARPNYIPVPDPASTPAPPSSTAAAPPPPPAAAAPALLRPTFRPPAPAAAATEPPAPAPAQTSQLPTSPIKPAAANGAPTAAPRTSPPKPVATNGAPTAALPTSPPKPAAAPPTSSVKTTSSPTQRPTNAPTSSTGNASPTALSRTLKPATETPPHSPPRKSTAPPPSPFTLPPAQLKSQEKLQPIIPIEAEQKKMLVQKTVGKPSNSHLDGKHELTTKHAEKKEKAHHKKPSSDSDETGMRIITISGENRGAFMELNKSRHKGFGGGNPHHLHNKGNGKSLSDASSEFHSYSSSDELGKQHKRDMHHKSMKATQPTDAYMNSNVQGVNNSIVYNSSYTHHDPGVHAVFSKKPACGGGGEHANVE